MKVVLIIPTNRPSDWNNIENNVKRQLLKPDLFIVVENGQDHSWSKADVVVTSEQNAGLARQAGIEEARKRCSGGFFVFMDGDDYYGPEYIREAYEARNKAEVIGKHKVFYKFDATGVLALSDGYESEMSGMIHGPTIAGHIDSCLDFHKCNTWGEDMDWIQRMQQSGAKVFATSRYNFCGKRNKNINEHTWSMPERMTARCMAMNHIVNGYSNLEDIVNGLEKPNYSSAPEFEMNTDTLR